MMQTDGEIHALIRGQARITLNKVVAHEPFLVGEVEEIPIEKEDSEKIKAMGKELAKCLKKAVNLGKQVEVMTVMRLISGQADDVN